MSDSDKISIKAVNDFDGVAIRFNVEGGVTLQGVQEVLQAKLGAPSAVSSSLLFQDEEGDWTLCRDEADWGLCVSLFREAQAKLLRLRIATDSPPHHRAAAGRAGAAGVPHFRGGRGRWPHHHHPRHHLHRWGRQAGEEEEEDPVASAACAVTAGCQQQNQHQHQRGPAAWVERVRTMKQFFAEGPSQEEIQARRKEYEGRPKLLALFDRLQAGDQELPPFHGRRGEKKWRGKEMDPEVRELWQSLHRVRLDVRALERGAPPSAAAFLEIKRLKEEVRKGEKKRPVLRHKLKKMHCKMVMKLKRFIRRTLCKDGSAEAVQRVQELVQEIGNNRFTRMLQKMQKRLAEGKRLGRCKDKKKRHCRHKRGGRLSSSSSESTTSPSSSSDSSTSSSDSSSSESESDAGHVQKGTEAESTARPLSAGKVGGESKQQSEMAQVCISLREMGFSATDILRVVTEEGADLEKCLSRLVNK